jgi:hypothetical protein
MPGMYSTRMRYSNYLKLLASARIYGICMDKEEYTKDEITVNNHDRTLYKMLEILLKV